MARRKSAPKREILPDPLFKSKLLAKFINTTMRRGKKSVAEKAVYGALDFVVKQLKKNNKLTSVAAENHHHDNKHETESTASTAKATGDIRQDEASRVAAIHVFKKALENVTPTVEVKSRRVGGSTYQVPVEIRATRRLTLAMRWIVEFANGRNEKTMMVRLGSEILDAIEGRGGAVKKREDVHRMAKANQAFAHYRW